ncbi:MAG: inositol monophosphatase [Gemmatimonadetes bacterium]|nr:inositol monophosphatase [Gemmatimonadota bacterium]
MPTDETTELVRVAVEAGRAAAAVHRRHLGQVRVADWSEKGVSDFVTHVDREAEERIVELVRRRYPGHAFLAEEAAAAAVTAAAPGAAPPEWLWIVDPLDGTTNYLHGYPMYAASVAVLHTGELVAGAVVAAATGEEWTAARGGGAFKNGERIRCSNIEHLRLALIGTGFPFKALERLPEYLRQFDVVLRHTAGIRRAGSAALDLCHLATGYFDGFWELVLSPWDVAAGTLIAREAGAIVTRPDGDPAVVTGVGAVLGGNPAIYGALAELLAGSW